MPKLSARAAPMLARTFSLNATFTCCHADQGVHGSEAQITIWNPSDSPAAHGPRSARPCRDSAGRSLVGRASRQHARCWCTNG
eukprot:15389572-Heterocapsa_arctica.AAC.1